MTAFEEGYTATSVYQNPYWIDYPKKTCSNEEQLNACDWVFGYAQSIIDRNKKNDNLCIYENQ